VEIFETLAIHAPVFLATTLSNVDRSHQVNPAGELFVDHDG